MINTSVECLQLIAPFFFQVSMLSLPAVGMLYQVWFSASLNEQDDTARTKKKKSSSWATSSFWVIWYYWQCTSSIEGEEEKRQFWTSLILHHGNAWGRYGSAREGRWKCAEKSRQWVWKGLMRQWVTMKMTTGLRGEKKNNNCCAQRAQRTTLDTRLKSD